MKKCSLNGRRGYYYVKLLCGVMAVTLLGAGAGSHIRQRKSMEAAGGPQERVEAPRIALTFDDGPREKSTERLLDELKKRDIKATFFLIGRYAEENPELVKRMYEEGHVIGNHTYSHVDLTRLSDAEAAHEMEMTDEIVYGITGEHVRYVRPPFGIWQRDLELDMEVLPVMWDIDPLDWTTENVDEIVNKVVTDAKENGIILLHDCYESSVDAALRIADLLSAQGYEFVTVEELILD